MKKINEFLKKNFGIVTLLACIAVTVLLFYVKNNTPSAQQICTQKCAKANKSGVLVYKGPLTPKSKPYDIERDCECN